MVKTADLALILDVKIAAALLHIVQHKVHRGEHKGEHQYRQNETVIGCAIVKKVFGQGTIPRYR